ncbi:MAG: hypothetical protein J6R47_02645, partial [Acholeplasmatales bacterium]|nr:hypothetical protein [Acholeplasmatales bacterium]
MRKLFGVLSVSALLFTLASCGNNNGGTNVEFDPHNNTIGYQWEDTSAAILAGENDITFNITSTKNAMAMDYNDMDVFKNLKASTNVNVNWNNISESAYTTQKSLILSNPAKYPDAIYHAGFTNKELIQYGTSRNVIVAIDEYLEYMPNLNRILTERPDIKAAIESPDGHIYSLPRVEEMGLKPYPNILFINKEWIGKLIDANKLSFNLTKDQLVDGLKLTRNQYKEILTYFKSMDMNGDGTSNDEIPLSFVHGNWQGNESDLIASFGIPENADHKTIVNGKVVFTVQDPKWRDAISELSMWVKDGLIETAAFEDSQDTFLAKGKVNSKGFEKLGSFYWWEMETVISEQEQENYITLQPLVDDATGKQYVGRSNLQEVEKGTCVVFNKCEYKEVLLTYLDRFYDPYVSAQINYGPIGVVYEEELQNGMLVNKPLPEGMTTDELRLKNSPLGCIFLSENEWKNNVVMEPRAVLRLERLEKYVKPYTYEGVQSFPNISYTLEEINSLARYETNLGDVINARVIEWLLAGKAVTD